MSIDRIANLVTTIKNGYLAEKTKIDIPYAKLTAEILKVMKKEKYIKNFKEKEIDGKKSFSVRLYYIEGSPALKDIRRVSKQGKRIYVKPDSFKPVLPFAKRKKDYGISIITTSKGVMTTKEAKKKNIGGELLLNIY